MPATQQYLNQENYQKLMCKERSLYYKYSFRWDKYATLILYLERKHANKTCIYSQKQFHCPNNALTLLSEETGWTWPKYLRFISELSKPYPNLNQAKTRLGTAGERKYVLVMRDYPPIIDKQRNLAKIQHTYFNFPWAYFIFFCAVTPSLFFVYETRMLYPEMKC